MPAPYPAVPRRNLTPEEQQQLWSQGSQGMQPAMGPMSLADMVMEPASALLDEADLSKYLLPLSLLGMVKGPKGKVPAATRQTVGHEAAEAAPRLPALTDNYLKPLSEYTPTLYRETSLYGALDFLPGVEGHLPAMYTSNQPGLALGQGSNKGVLVELDSAGLHGTVNTRKPAWQHMWDQGAAEFEIRQPERESLRNSVRSITVRPDAVITRGEKLRFRHQVRDWDRIENADGSITYIKPSK